MPNKDTSVDMLHSIVVELNNASVLGRDNAIHKAETALSAMVAEILGDYSGNDLVLRSNLTGQRQRAKEKGFIL